MILIDITKNNAKLKKLLIMLLLISGIIGVLLIGFYYIFLNIIERKLLKAEEEKDISHQARAVVYELLSISVRDISMTEMLRQVIESLTSFSWLALVAKGGIFLVEDDPDTLVLKAQLGFAEPIQKMCARVPFGRCLCGRAAASGQVVHADCIDERHENTYEGIAAHGHYCVPVLSPLKKVWGVIVLYVQHGHAYNEKEKEFLVSVANVMSGIIERKKMNETITQAIEEQKKTNESLLKLNKLKDKFLGMAAHDMRNPLTSIRGFSELLLTDEGGPISEGQRSYLKIINSTSNEMLIMLNDILDFTMIESGKLDLKLSPASLNELVEQRTMLLHPVAKNKNIRFYLNFSVMPEIFLDSKRIIQVIDNLISNAIKFSPSGASIWLTVRLADRFMEFIVRDQGPGISEEDMPKLFGEFQKLSAQPTGGESSTGLGLSIAMKITRAHLGDIRVESEPGVGSTFILSLPIEKRQKKERRIFERRKKT